MKVISVVGARPQFVKLAPMERAFAEAGVRHSTIHTGQHYDYEMSDSFFDSLGIEAPTWNLGVGSGSHGVQTGAMLAALDELLADERPDWVVVYGDTNSTVAAALAAVKLHLPVAHLEAGLRSFNRLMPEEHNRVLTDHAADLLLAPTEVAAAHLATEGLADRTVVVGDVMVDVLLNVTSTVDRSFDLGFEGIGPEEEFVLATVHRAENTDDPVRLGEILDALASLPIPVVLPVHPRVRSIAVANGLPLDQGSLVAVEPLPYERMVAALMRARAVATDSGGLQKEAFVVGTPTTTLRTETEWVETLEDGWNVLAPELEDFSAVVLRGRPTGRRATPYGRGDAADRAVAAIAEA
jgi:UDP-N-acetylglucosamine 2-epimerase (non-hydrolysing)